MTMPWDEFQSTTYPPSASVEETLNGETAEPESVKQPTLHPTPKVGLGVGLGGGVLVGVQVWLQQRFGVDLLDIEIALMVWIGSFLAAYQTKDRK